MGPTELDPAAGPCTTQSLSLPCAQGSALCPGLVLPQWPLVALLQAGPTVTNLSSPCTPGSCLTLPLPDNNSQTPQLPASAGFRIPYGNVVSILSGGLASENSIYHCWFSYALMRTYLLNTLNLFTTRGHQKIFSSRWALFLSLFLWIGKEETENNSWRAYLECHLCQPSGHHFLTYLITGWIQDDL